MDHKAAWLTDDRYSRCGEKWCLLLCPKYGANSSVGLPGHEWSRPWLPCYSHPMPPQLHIPFILINLKHYRCVTLFLPFCLCPVPVYTYVMHITKSSDISPRSRRVQMEGRRPPHSPAIDFPLWESRCSERRKRRNKPLLALQTDILNPIVVGESEKGEKGNKNENKAFAQEAAANVKTGKSEKLLFIDMWYVNSFAMYLLGLGCRGEHLVAFSTCIPFVVLKKIGAWFCPVPSHGILEGEQWRTQGNQLRECWQHLMFSI